MGAILFFVLEEARMRRKVTCMAIFEHFCHLCQSGFQEECDRMSLEKHPVAKIAKTSFTSY